MSSMLNNSLLVQTSIASLLVIFGVVLKNSLEQAKMSNNKMLNNLGMLMFAFGWIYLAYILSIGRENKVTPIVSSLAILVSVMMMKQYMKDKKEVPIYLPAMFSVAWLAIGYYVSSHLTGNMKYMGLLASVCVLVGMLYSLPYQRKNCIVDGPGMPLFVIAWAMIVYFNSLRSLEN